MKTETPDKYLPCPFCGAKPIKRVRLSHFASGEEHFIDCSGCGASVPSSGSRAVITMKWNRRELLSTKEAE